MDKRKGKKKKGKVTWRMPESRLGIIYLKPSRGNKESNGRKRTADQ